MLRYLLNVDLNFQDITAGCFITPFLICLVLVLTVARALRRRHEEAPGPPRLPLIGNLLTLSGKDINGTLRKLQEKYGNVFSLYLGQEVVVVLNSYDTVYDALVRNGRLFSDRPMSPFQKMTMQGSAILFSNGKVWKEQRSFAQKTLKEICFGDSGRHIEEILSDEVAHVLKHLDEIQTATDIQHIIHEFSLNVIVRVMFGIRFENGDKRAKYLINIYHDIGMDIAKMQVLVNCFPLLQKLPGDFLSLKMLNAKRQKLQSLITNLITDKLSNHESCRRSFVDAYQEEIEKSKLKEKTEANSSFSERLIPHACSDMVGAASDTTANAIVWIILHLIREQTIQENMFREIDEILGADVGPKLSDRKLMPYTQAVIYEGLRISNSTPLALPHAVSEDLKFHGYFLPTGATILVNLTSVLKDPNNFKDPDVFRPERFLNSDKDEVVNVPEFIPFSLGPRSCLGESLARMQLFMIITSIVQRFKLLPEEDSVLPRVTGQLSTVYKPEPFSVRLMRRMIPQKA